MCWQVSYFCGNRRPMEICPCYLCWMACTVFAFSIPGQGSLYRYVSGARLIGRAFPSHGRGYQLNLAVPTIQQTDKLFRLDILLLQQFLPVAFLYLRLIRTLIEFLYLRQIMLLLPKFGSSQHQLYRLYIECLPLNWRLFAVCAIDRRNLDY